MKQAKSTLQAEKEVEEKEGGRPCSDHQVSPLRWWLKSICSKLGEGVRTLQELCLGLRVRLSLDPHMAFRIYIARAINYIYIYIIHIYIYYLCVHVPLCMCVFFLPTVHSSLTGLLKWLYNQ